MLENLTLFLWGLWQDFRNLTLCIDKLCVWESVIVEAVRDVLLLTWLYVVWSDWERYFE